jgi:O-antigen ligase
MSVATRLPPGLPRPRVGGSEVALALGLSWAVGFSFLGWLAMMSVLPYQGYGLAGMVAAFVVVPAIGLWCVARAGSQGGGFLGFLVVVVILFSDLSLRGFSGKLDAQSGVKFALWISGLLLLPWRGSVVRTAQRDVPTFALLLFGLWALLTTAYSITPIYTFAAALGFLGFWVLAVVFATSYETERGWLWLPSTLLAMSCASLLLYFAAPDVAMVAYENATVRRLGGIYGNANQVGETAALALLLFFAIWFQLRARVSLLLLLVAVPVCAACLLLSQSRTSMLGLGAAIIVVLLRRYPILLLPTISIGAATGAVVYAYPDAIDVLIGLVARSGNVTQVTTFTGRTEIWHFVMSSIEKAPLLGYGFASTRELIPAGHSFGFGWTTNSAHNLWLQAWVTTGAVGLVFILVSQFGSLKALATNPLPIRDAVLSYVVFVGLLESGPVGPTVNLLTFVWIWATALSLRARRETAG